MFTTRRSVVYKSLRRRRRKKGISDERNFQRSGGILSHLCIAHTHTAPSVTCWNNARGVFVWKSETLCLIWTRIGSGGSPALMIYIFIIVAFIYFPPFFCSCCPAQKKNKQENNEMRWRRRSVGWFMTSKWAVQTRWASFLFVYFSVVVSLYVTATRGEKRGCVRLCAGRNACLLRLRWTNVSALTRFRCVERKRERLFLPACIYI